MYEVAYSVDDNSITCITLNDTLCAETMNKHVSKVYSNIPHLKWKKTQIRGMSIWYAYSFTMVLAHPFVQAGSSTAYSLRFNEPKLAHKSHSGNSHYLLFNRFADTDCTWILLDLFGFENSTTTKSTATVALLSSRNTQYGMKVKMELNFQRKAFCNRRNSNRNDFHGVMSSAAVRRKDKTRKWKKRRKKQHSTWKSDYWFEWKWSANFHFLCFIVMATGADVEMGVRCLQPE